ncbi:hypothetical protein SAMN05660841_01513 [Sphingobacterium nematocida]|uniref:Uncharacterized protein n=1 Tax=Sphingobacterium nematocida TaxID=1513896 RepID=A0A1T5CQ03_9SPHI|nr:hypothetical protein [Sphingobacterium nematocida]SKB61575.1 hypothetical protein SAMN05660841_01513 [Sphingobacterium nematocida]
METIFNYESASVALKKLTDLGYTIDYNVLFEELFNAAEEYTIDYLYRYEGATDPSDESTVYGIRNIVTNDKGVFVVGDLSLVESKKREIILNLELRSKNGGN